jgi:hypothetical protein
MSQEDTRVLLDVEEMIREAAIRTPEHYVFTPPVSAMEAQQRRGVLSLQIEAIRAALVERARTSATDSDTYQDWRRRAKIALRYRETDFRCLGTWVQTHERQTARVTATEHRGHDWRVIQRIAERLRDKPGLTEEDRRVLDAADKAVPEWFRNAQAVKPKESP